MEPLTTIDLEGCTWLGVMILLSAIAADFLSELLGSDRLRTGFADRERAHRAQRPFRTR